MSNSPDVAQTPIRTTLIGAISILVPIAIVTAAAAAILVNSDRDHDDFKENDTEFRKDLDEAVAVSSTIVDQQFQNTIDLNVVINEVKNTNETVTQLTTLVNTILNTL